MNATRNTNKVAKQRISKEMIRALANAESFARGRSYASDGSVSDLLRRGDRLTAEVEGSEFEPYQVSIRLHGDGVADAHCTCPYDWRGYCKHIVAVLLKFADKKTPVIERKPIAELLAELDQARLIELLEKRTE
ncbi:MAG: SWIM zinc finger family protein, partial [Bradyrhizobium sp.]